MQQIRSGRILSLSNGGCCPTASQERARSWSRPCSSQTACERDGRNGTGSPGRFYVIGVLILAPLGAYIEYFEERLGSARSFTIATAAFAALLLVTTGIAFFYALKRKIPQHRQWMTRSYAVALVFFENRLILGVTGWEALGEKVAETVLWACLAFAILLGDLVNQWQESHVPLKTGSRALSKGVVLQTAHVDLNEPGR